MADLVIDNTIEAIVLPNGEELELGTTPTGNIDITQAGVTDVSDYATATVPLGEISTSVFSGSYYTENNARKWRIRSWAGVVEGDGEGHRGWINDDTQINSDYAVYKAIPTNTHVTPTTSAQTIGAANTMLEGAVTVDAIPSQYIVPSGTKSITANGTGIDVKTYASVDVAVPSGSPTLETVPKSYTPTESQQTETITPSTGYDGIGEVDVTVGAISSSYVGTAIDRRDSTDLSASGATVTAPAGYYASSASASVSSGTEGTPTATKGTVSSHAVTVTPSVTNSAGYISGGTHTGTGVSVSASELVSGTYNVTSSGTKDVTNYASASVPAGSATSPATITGTSATVSTGTNTLTLTKSVSVTPSVTAGYVSAGTAGNSSVSLTASVTTQGAQTLYPSTTDQTITGSKYLTGTQTFKAVTTSNLTADNIKSGVTVTVGDSADADRILSVTGTYSGGGGTLTVKTATHTQTATGQTLSFTSLSGQPKYWFCRVTSQVSSSGSTTIYYITDLFYDGTNIKGNSFRIGSTRRIYNITSGISQSYSSGTLTITGGSTTGSSPGQFYGASGITYELVYLY